MPKNADWRQAVQADGFAVVPNILASETVEYLRQELAGITDAESASTQNGNIFGVRNLLAVCPAVRVVSEQKIVRSLAQAVLGDTARVVRAILFDKTPNVNWKVPYHQDLTIAVRHRHDVPGFGVWSTKSGIAHVQPPDEILTNLLTLRLHLDDTDAANGALRVLLGTHLRGRLDAAQIQAARHAQTEVLCTVPAGGALVMRPLLLHASSAATNPTRRRVVHLEWAAHELPAGLEWFGS